MPPLQRQARTRRNPFTDRPGAPVSGTTSEIFAGPGLQWARLAAVKTRFDMGIPFNELNRVFDLGFKPLPWGDIAYLPTKLQPIGRTDS